MWMYTAVCSYCFSKTSRNSKGRHKRKHIYIDLIFDFTFQYPTMFYITIYI